MDWKVNGYISLVIGEWCSNVMLDIVDYKYLQNFF